MSISKEKFEEMKKERMSQTFTTSYGTPYKIIEYYSATNVVVQFCDSHGFKKKTTYNEAKKGWATNPFDKTVYGIGYRGDYQGKLPSREYQLWNSMMVRCYNPKYHEKEPTYKECTVCERWHNFTNFLEDLPLIEGYEMWKSHLKGSRQVCLDKDVKGKNKVYSVNTCCFILHKDNVAEANSRTKGTCLMGTHEITGETILFNSVKEALTFLGIKGRYGIKTSCEKQKCYRGYYWTYITDVALQ